jgi:multiple sugar transport system permease protein
MRSEGRAALLFLAPALVLLTVFFFAPVIAGLALSLTDFDLYTIGDASNLRFVGVRNYAELLSSGIFWTAFANTMYFALVGGPLTVAVSLAAALLLNAKLTRFKPLFRTIYFAPVVTTLVAVSIVFKYLYHPRFGMLNRFLDTIGLPQPDWLGNPKLAMLAVCCGVSGKTWTDAEVPFRAEVMVRPPNAASTAEPRSRAVIT